jgi:hypothetical protein
VIVQIVQIVPTNWTITVLADRPAPIGSRGTICNRGRRGHPRKKGWDELQEGRGEQ